MMRTIKTTVSILTPLSHAVSLAGLTSFPPAKAIQVALGILLDAANGVITSYDVLADLLESIERFVDRLQQYTQLPPTPAMDEVLIKLNVELISTLAHVTGKLNNRRSLKLVKNFLGVKDIKEARQRLDRLVQEEGGTTTAEIFGDVARIERRLLGDGEASTDGLRKVPGTVCWQRRANEFHV